MSIMQHAVTSMESQRPPVLRSEDLQLLISNPSPQEFRLNGAFLAKLGLLDKITELYNTGLSLENAIFKGVILLHFPDATALSIITVLKRTLTPLIVFKKPLDPDPLSIAPFVKCEM